MSNPEGSGAFEFVDWDAVRKTEEYRKQIVGFLKIRLGKLLHAPDYDERFNRGVEADGERLKGMTAGEFMDSIEDGDPFLTEEEHDIDQDIFGLETIEDVERYVHEIGLDFDVQEEVRRLEGTYLEDQRRLEAAKEEHKELFDRARKLIAGDGDDMSDLLEESGESVDGKNDKDPYIQ